MSAHLHHDAPFYPPGSRHPNSPPQQRSEEEEERAHFLAVCRAFAEYHIDAEHEVMRIETHLRELSTDDLALLSPSVDERVRELMSAVSGNQQFLDTLLSHHCDEVEDLEGSPVPPPPPGTVGPFSPHQRAMDALAKMAHNMPLPPVTAQNQAKVRSTIRQFVRDWTAEGEVERKQCYQPLLEALEKYLPLDEFMQKKNGERPRVLCPGSGLGRLPFEVVRLGYHSQGNEFSFFMLIGSNFVINSAIPVESISIQPFCLSTCNRMQRRDHLREVFIPDVAPQKCVPEDCDFSMCAGEFCEVYAGQVGQWDAVLTCFFIDTAKNVIQYIRMIAELIPEGGYWINLGPLLYHFADMPDEISIELAWDEVRPIITEYFTFVEESMKDSFYATNGMSMMQVLYHCVFFVGQRNSVKVHGESKPVN